MLLRLLLSRGAPAGSTMHAFRWRGDGVSRIEGLSDTVFGFAITLVAVSLEIPKTAQELMHNALGFIPFVASFLVLFFFWRAQFEFFRRYGLEDGPTLWCTGLLLVFVLFLIYPLKFLFTVFGDAILVGDVAKDRLRLEQFPGVLALYVGGFAGIALAFALLYRHAYARREALELTEVEAFDTLSMYRRWVRALSAGILMLGWCGAMIAMPGHMRARDHVFASVLYGGYAVVMASGLLQVYAKRRTERTRAALVARIATDSPSGAAVLE